MTEPVLQPLRSSRAARSTGAGGARLRPRQTTSVRGASLLTGALGFFSFIPYPALAVGSRTAVQFGNVLALLMVPSLLFVAWRRRPFWIYVALLAPLCLSTLHVGLAGVGDVSLSLKAVSVWIVFSLTTVTVQLYAPRFAAELLTGMAAATVLHAGVGFLQLYSFSRGEFPLAWLYVNPAFLSVQENADVIARYTRRPFGLFPEPSAMSSSLAPWVIFWAAYLCGVVRLKREPAPWQRKLFGAAATGGVGLMIISQSGHTAVALLALIPFTFIWFVRLKATARSYVAIVAVFAVLLPVVLWLATSSLSNRIGNSPLGNSSWEDRSASMRIGLELFEDGGLATMIFGMGPGLSAPAIQRYAGLDAVWSIVLPYVYETGLLGAMVLCWIGAYLLWTWASVRYDPTFAAVFGVWLVGITLTTSYTDLLPLWITLAWLTVWPDVCQPAAPRRLVQWKQTLPSSPDKT